MVSVKQGSEPSRLLLVGGCLYFLLTGHDPEFLGDGDGQYAGVATDSVLMLNTLLQKCWKTECASIADLETEIVLRGEIWSTASCIGDGQQDHENGKSSRTGSKNAKATTHAADLISTETLILPLLASYSKVDNLNQNDGRLTLLQLALSAYQTNDTSAVTNIEFATCPISALSKTSTPCSYSDLPFVSSLTGPRWSEKVPGFSQWERRHR